MAYLIAVAVGLSALLGVFGILAVISDFVVNPRGREDGQHVVLRVGVASMVLGCGGLIMAASLYG